MDRQKKAQICPLGFTHTRYAIFSRKLLRDELPETVRCGGLVAETFRAAAA